MGDALAMRLDLGPSFLHADASPTSPSTSPMHRRCIADVSAMRRNSPTPSTRIPSGRWNPLPL
eukprot:73928-Pyramimonas_sp.AAC.1